MKAKRGGREGSLHLLQNMGDIQVISDGLGSIKLHSADFQDYVTVCYGQLEADCFSEAQAHKVQSPRGSSLPYVWSRHHTRTDVWHALPSLTGDCAAWYLEEKDTGSAYLWDNRWHGVWYNPDIADPLHLATSIYTPRYHLYSIWALPPLQQISDSKFSGKAQNRRWVSNSNYWQRGFRDCTCKTRERFAPYCPTAKWEDRWSSSTRIKKS